MPIHWGEKCEPEETSPKVTSLDKEHAVHSLNDLAVVTYQESDKKDRYDPEC